MVAGATCPPAREFRYPSRRPVGDKHYAQEAHTDAPQPAREEAADCGPVARGRRLTRDRAPDPSVPSSPGEGSGPHAPEPGEDPPVQGRRTDRHGETPPPHHVLLVEHHVDLPFVPYPSLPPLSIRQNGRLPSAGVREGAWTRVPKHPSGGVPRGARGWSLRAVPGVAPGPASGIEGKAA
jgi:hypothetical protein